MSTVFQEVKDFLGKTSGKIVIGIDPGATGGFALLSEDGSAEAWDIPVLDRAVRRGTKTARSSKGSISIPDYGEIVEIFSLLASSGRVKKCVLEKIPPRVSARPLTIGDVKAFGSYMMWPLFLYALRFVIHEVAPVVWKKAFGLIGQKNKEAHRAVALQLFPGCKALALKSKTGRVDALLLARYGTKTD